MNLINRKVIYLFSSVVFLTGAGSLIATPDPTGQPPSLGQLEHGSAGNSADDNIVAKSNPDRNTYPSTIPDFVSFAAGDPRKTAFHNYFSPIIEQENQRILTLRNKILNMSTEEDLAISELKTLGKRYRIKSGDPQELKNSLLQSVDTLPASLVLAQGAIESAWGTSRFARVAHNYFGQWCYTKNCGIIPADPRAGQHYELRRFSSPGISLRSYLFNINSNPAYAELRRIRFRQRNNQESLSGCYLAEGLKSYSEEGDRYITSVKRVIKYNQWETSSYCAPEKINENKLTGNPAPNLKASRGTTY